MDFDEESEQKWQTGLSKYLPISSALKLNLIINLTSVVVSSAIACANHSSSEAFGIRWDVFELETRKVVGACVEVIKLNEIVNLPDLARV